MDGAREGVVKEGDAQMRIDRQHALHHAAEDRFTPRRFLFDARQHAAKMFGHQAKRACHGT